MTVRAVVGSVAVMALVSSCSDDDNGGGTGGDGEPACVTDARPHSLPKPTEVGRAAYLTALKAFLESFEYRKLGWCEDKGTVRDTGPYIDGSGYLGTHPPVHMAYSPQAMDWLLGGREGEMPDGTLIIKEQFYGGKPAAAFQDLSPAELDELFADGQAGWTTMFKDATGAVDGWFWAETHHASDPDALDSSEYFTDNFGSPCIRCHASAETQSTFIDTENIAGFAGEPITYEIQDGWKTAEPPPPPPADFYKTTSEYKAFPLAFGQWDPDPTLNASWLAQFDSMAAVPEADVVAFPPATLDHVPHPAVEQYFVTADQCFGCHGGFRATGTRCSCKTRAVWVPTSRPLATGVSRPWASPDEIRSSTRNLKLRWRWLLPAERRTQRSPSSPKG
jgi:hypothetical protein